MNPVVPSFPAFRKISIEDKALFEAYFAKHPSGTSELTFTNFYIWRDCDNSQVTSLGGNLCILARPENEFPYFFEILGDHDVDKAIDACLSYNPRFSRVSEVFIKAHFEGKRNVSIEPDKNNSDYLYRTEDLIELKGKKYDGKRNKIKKLLKSCQPQYKALTADDMPSCLKLLGKWAGGRNSGVCFEVPIKEALDNFSGLNVKGAAILINGKVEAFTVGEKMSADTAVIYIEVANPDIDGLPQYINQQFCKNQWAATRFINREQDLGNPGLRKAKQSYHPVQMMNKFDVTLID